MNPSSSLPNSADGEEADMTEIILRNEQRIFDLAVLNQDKEIPVLTWELRGRENWKIREYFDCHLHSANQIPSLGANLSQTKWQNKFSNCSSYHKMQTIIFLLNKDSGKVLFTPKAEDRFYSYLTFARHLDWQQVLAVRYQNQAKNRSFYILKALMLKPAYVEYAESVKFTKLWVANSPDCTIDIANTGRRRPLLQNSLLSLNGLLFGLDKDEYLAAEQ